MNIFNSRKIYILLVGNVKKNFVVYNTFIREEIVQFQFLVCVGIFEFGRGDLKD